ncbi:MAG: DUF2157 domain-containing protein [Dehalococcoidia bacterium]
MSFQRALPEESAGWVDEGIISPEQRERLLARYPEEPARSHVATIIALVGGAIAVLGVTLIVATNWNDIPLMVKLATGEALLVVLFTLGYWLRFGSPHRWKTGEAVLLIASGVFLGDLALVSQQYHIETNPSRYFLALWLSVVALPYLLRSRAYALVSASAFVVFLIVEMVRDGSPLEVSGFAIVLLLVPIGAAVLAAGALHRGDPRLAPYAAPIEFVGAAFLFGAIYILGFYRHIADEEDLVTRSEPVLSVILWLVLPLALLVAAAALAARRGLLRPPLTARSLAVAIGWLVLAASIVWAWLVIFEPRVREERDFIIWTVGFWLLALALTAVVAWLGVAYRRGWWLNLALVYLGVFILTRYFDLFEGYGQTGLLFLGAGVLLLAVAFVLERSRRTLMQLSDASEGGEA